MKGSSPLIQDRLFIRIDNYSALRKLESYKKQLKKKERGIEKEKGIVWSLKLGVHTLRLLKPRG